MEMAPDKGTLKGDTSMEKIKIVWLGCVIILLGVMGWLIVETINNPAGYSIFINNDTKIVNLGPDPRCQEIQIEINNSIKGPYYLKEDTLYINPDECMNLSMPEEFKQVYDVSNGPINYSFNPSKENIIVIGDSYSFGSGVEKEESFSYLLNQEGDYNIINLGIPGFNTKLEVERLKAVGLTYMPKYVVIQFCENDLEDTKKIWSLIMNVSNYIQSMKKLDCIHPFTQDNKIFMGLYSIAYDNTILRDESKSINENILVPLEELNWMSKKNNFSVIFLLLPSDKEYVKEMRDKIAQEYHWKIIDMEKEMDFPGWKPPFTISLYNPHFSVETNSKVADILYKEISKNIDK